MKQQLAGQSFTSSSTTILPCGMHISQISGQMGWSGTMPISQIAIKVRWHSKGAHELLVVGLALSAAYLGSRFCNTRGRAIVTVGGVALCSNRR